MGILSTDNLSIEFAEDGTPGALVANSTIINIVQAQTNPLTGNIIKNIWNGTQAQYDALAVKDDSTLYVIVA